ncbi:MAG: DUF2520 domain-containing protein [Bacteroidota bacterium]
MKIVIIGSGNVAWHLAKIAKEKSHEIIQLANFHSTNISSDFDAFNIPYIYDIKELSIEADLYIIAIKDSKIDSLQIPFTHLNKLFIHTSGIASIDVLSKYSVNHACLYPLQTLTKGIATDFSKIPILVEASNEETNSIALEFASTLSYSIHSYSLEQRRKLHLNAVVVNNFTNHLFHLAQLSLKENQLDFNLLLPLIQETIRKLNDSSAYENQTGPARRYDLSTINLHEGLLDKEELLLEIYRLISKSIIDTYHPKDN